MGWGGLGVEVNTEEIISVLAAVFTTTCRGSVLCARSVGLRLGGPTLQRAAPPTGQQSRPGGHCPA